MEVKIIEKELQQGSVVIIGDNYYMVVSLISCVSYEYDRHGRHYLMNLEGGGYHNYPTSLEDLRNQIANANGRVLDKDHYYIEKLRVNKNERRLK